MNKCKIDFCGKKYYAKGFCGPHYQKNRRYGDPLYGGSKNSDLPGFRDPDRVCSVEGCDNKHDARGFCSSHYRKYMAYGTPYGTFKRVERKCSIEGCENKHNSRGYCKNHYRESLVGKKPKPSEKERFWSKVDKTPGCWYWTRGKNANGYGSFSVSGGSAVAAHRYAWEEFNGRIPDGLVVDHRCQNRSCVNPEHLRLIAPGQNRQNLVRYRNGKARGVREDPKGSGRWFARVRSNGDLHSRGPFLTEAEADRVAKDMRSKFFAYDDYEEWVAENTGTC